MKIYIVTSFVVVVAAYLANKIAIAAKIMQSRIMLNEKLMKKKCTRKIKQRNFTSISEINASHYFV